MQSSGAMEIVDPTLGINDVFVKEKQEGCRDSELALEMCKWCMLVHRYHLLVQYKGIRVGSTWSPELNWHMSYRPAQFCSTSSGACVLILFYRWPLNKNKEGLMMRREQIALLTACGTKSKYIRRMNLGKWVQCAWTISKCRRVITHFLSPRLLR